MGEKRRNTCLTVTEAAPGPKLNLGGKSKEEFALRLRD